MPFCQAPIKSNIFNNQKCGAKIIPNSDLHLCPYHYNILLNSKQNNIIILPSSLKCLLCMKNIGEFKNGVCKSCFNCDRDIQPNDLLKSFILDKTFYTCDTRVKELYKDYLGQIDNSIPRIFDFQIDETTKYIEIKSQNTNKRLYYDNNYNILQRTYL